jgi:hypothetical protein
MSKMSRKLNEQRLYEAAQKTFTAEGGGRAPVAQCKRITTYAAHAAEIDAAVRRRVAAGSHEPVMLRDPDVRPGPWAHDGP